MKRKPYHKQFVEQLDDVERRARKCGSSITAICRDAGVARATPDRWRNKAPETIDVMDRLLESLEKAEQAANVSASSV